jgi:uncharacterized protein (TIGR03067 family)
MERINVVVGLVVLGFVAAHEIPAQDVKTELEGSWDLIGFEKDGKKVQDPKSAKLTVKGATFVVSSGDKIIAGGTSKLNTKKTPKEIDAMYTEGADKGKSYKGIYKLEGDTLTFCRAGAPEQERPSEFKTKAGSGMFVSVYKRAKQ